MQINSGTTSFLNILLPWSCDEGLLSGLLDDPILDPVCLSRVLLVMMNNYGWCCESSLGLYHLQYVISAID